MSSLADQLRSDLAALRNCIVAQRLHAAASLPLPDSETLSVVAADQQHPLQQRSPHAKPLLKSQSSALSSSSAAAAAATSPVDPLCQLQEDLQAATAQLHAERAAVAQLRIQQRCDEAAILRLTEQTEEVDGQLAQATSERDAWQQRCTAVEAIHAKCAVHHSCVREQVEALQQHVKDVEAVHATLTASAAELRRVAARLTQENTRLHEMLKGHAAELFRLSSVEVDLRAAQQRLCTFEQRQEEWEGEMRRLQGYFTSVKDEYATGMELVAALQHEHRQLEAALAQSEAQCNGWAQLFMDSAVTPPAGKADDTLSDGGKEEVEDRVAFDDASKSPRSPLDTEVPSTTTSSTLANLQRRQADTEDDDVSFAAEERRDGAHGSREHRAAFTQQLEAKVADLAVQLFAAQARAAQAERHVEQLAQVQLVDMAVLTELKAMVCVLRPQTESLATYNAQLQARLLATECMTEPLMEYVVQLATAYTEEVCRRCNPQLCSPGHREGGGEAVLSVKSSTDAGSAEERGTTVPPPAQREHVPGKRHRLRVTALQPRRGA